MLDLEAAQDRIYEAAFVPGGWPRVLDMVAEIAGAVGTILIADDFHNPSWLNSPSLDGFLDDFMAGEWGRVDSRMPKLLAANKPGFVVEDEVYTREEFARDPLIQGFLRPRGFGWATATFFPMLNGGNLVVSVERRYADGPVPQSAIAALNAIRPHLQRAARLSAGVGFERNRAVVDAFVDSGIAAGIVSRNDRLTVANDKLKPLMPAIVRDARERIAFAEPCADAVLARALENPCASAAVSIPIRRHDGQDAYVADLLPIRGAAQDIFAGGKYLLVMSPVSPTGAPPSELLQALFKLTAAEARVLRALVLGYSATEIAQEHDVSLETVRSQIKALFVRTGVKRQIDLVRLVSGRIPRQ